MQPTTVHLLASFMDDRELVVRFGIKKPGSEVALETGVTGARAGAGAGVKSAGTAEPDPCTRWAWGAPRHRGLPRISQSQRIGSPD